MSNKKIIILFACIIIVGFGGLLLAKTGNKQTATRTTPPTSVNKKTQSSQPSFVNFATLTDNGISSNQLAAVEYAYSQYITADKLPVHTVTLDTSSLQFPYRDPNNTSGVDSLSFKSTLDMNSVSAKVEYSGVNAARLYLYKSGTQELLYDSQMVDLYK
jgi:hypothetical protein